MEDDLSPIVTKAYHNHNHNTVIVGFARGLLTIEIEITWQDALTLIDQLQAAAEKAEEAERCNGDDPFDTAISQFEDSKWYKNSEF